MKVWVVTFGYFYEGSEVISINRSKDTAMAACDRHNGDRKRKLGEYQTIPDKLEWRQLSETTFIADCDSSEYYVFEAAIQN